MAKVEKIWNLGEKIEGVVLRPDQVDVRGVFNDAGQYALAIKVISDAGEALTIMLPLEYVGMFTKLIDDAHDELQAAMTAQRS
jgi:CO dehydrogenase/acetyl-CoA synthase gamma subunit (corrinoid Fe-S protein)